MSWMRYAVELRLLSPVHIGWRKLGNLQQTRTYVTGKVIWAALTARLTRDLGKGTQGEAYKDIGAKLHENFRFSYFYPAIKKGENEEKRFYTQYFWETENFDYLFLNSFGSAAIEWNNRVSEKGTLHEVEYISPRSRTGEQVYLRGDIWVKECILKDLETWCVSLGRVCLGGERTYGWGRVALDCEPVVLEKTDAVLVDVEKGEHVAAHVDAESVGEGVIGCIEPLVGWEYTAENCWSLTKDVKMAYIPGSVVLDRMRFEVGRFGVLRRVEI